MCGTGPQCHSLPHACLLVTCQWHVQRCWAPKEEKGIVQYQSRPLPAYFQSKRLPITSAFTVHCYRMQTAFTSTQAQITHGFINLIYSHYTRLYTWTFLHDNDNGRVLWFSWIYVCAQFEKLEVKAVREKPQQAVTKPITWHTVVVNSPYADLSVLAWFFKEFLWFPSSQFLFLQSVR